MTSSLYCHLAAKRGWPRWASKAIYSNARPDGAWVGRGGETYLDAIILAAWRYFETGNRLLPPVLTSRHRPGRLPLSATPLPVSACGPDLPVIDGIPLDCWRARTHTNTRGDGGWRSRGKKAALAANPPTVRRTPVSNTS